MLSSSSFTISTLIAVAMILSSHATLKKGMKYNYNRPNINSYQSGVRPGGAFLMVPLSGGMQSNYKPYRGSSMGKFGGGYPSNGGGVVGGGSYPVLNSGSTLIAVLGGHPYGGNYGNNQNYGSYGNSGKFGK